MNLSSRPEAEEEPGLALSWLTDEELELISAFLYPTRLGKGISPYRDAAFTLMEKIEAVKGSQFLADAAMNVSLMVDVLDDQGIVIQTLSQDTVEFAV
jgi:hypothetical protein